MKKFFVAAALMLSVLIGLGDTMTFAAEQRYISKIPVIRFLNTVKQEYYTGDRISFSVNAPNYKGRVEYRAVLQNTATQKAVDLWGANNGFPDHYYKKVQPIGNSRFTIGFPIKEPGTYKVIIYIRRIGLNNKLYANKSLKCDSYIATRAFAVKARKQVEISYLGVLLSDGTKMQASNLGDNEYFIDLSALKSGTGVKALIKANQNSQLIIIDERLKNADSRFALKANEERSFGPEDLRMPDNDPPGVSIDALRDTYADASGSILGKGRLDSGSGSREFTLKMKVK